MPDERDRLPSTNHPLNAAPRRRAPAVLAVVGLVVAVAVIVAVITWARYVT